MAARRLSAEIAVVGAGPAGVAAACRAAEAGAATVMLDEGFAPGGQIYRHLPGQPVPERLSPWLSRLERSGAEGIFEASVFDARSAADDAGGGGFRLSAVRRAADGSEETLVIGARRLVLATGARELFLPFPGWTLPGVVGLGGAQALVKGGFDAAGRSAVVAGSGPLLLPVAAALARAGARVRLVAEQAPWSALARFALGLLGRPGKVREAIDYRAACAATPFRAGTWVSAAAGAGRVEMATLVSGRRSFAVPCDLLAVSYGLVPGSELARLLGCRVAGREVAVDGVQQTSVPGIFAAGEPCGIGGVDAALAQGEIAGAAAAGAFAADSLDGRRLLAARRDARRFAAALSRAFALRPELATLATAETVVCRCEDVPRGALAAAWGSRQAKLAARVGMGACQGRICGPALSFLFGWEADAVRPPLQPVALEHLLAQEESA